MAQPRILVLADSLAFHGPEHAELLTHPGLFPNVMATALHADVDVVARVGWTARDAWWALTRDPRVYSIDLPRAAALVITVGGMDHLPASVPTWLREGIAFVRPAVLRARVRSAYHAYHPHGVRLYGRRLRILPQAATDAYLSRIVQAVHVVRPGLPIVVAAPAPYGERYYPETRNHRPAVEAARRWAAVHPTVALLELDPLVQPGLDAGTHNPDGMHWGWDTHARVGNALADVLRPALGSS